MIDVRGRWALVTGASRGIGRLAALCLAEQGSNLILHSRKLEHCQAVQREAEMFGVSVQLMEADLSDLTAVERMLSRIDALGVPVDIICNNAGVQVAYRENILDTPMSDYDTSFRINTMAPMMICYHFLPKMTERGFGRIINTTSGIQLEPQQAGYSASKAALDKVTIDLGCQYEGTDVMLNLTDPGWCRTELGGPLAPNAPDSAIPGVVVGVFLDDKKSGRCFLAQDYRGLTLIEAARKAAQETASPYQI